MIPSKDIRRKRECFIDGGFDYGWERYSCIFANPDFGWGTCPCMNENSQYKSQDDRRGRDCIYHVTITEVTMVLDWLNAECIELE